MLAVKQTVVVLVFQQVRLNNWEYFEKHFSQRYQRIVWDGDLQVDSCIIDLLLNLRKGTH
jgi:hypothetical protein